MSVRPIPLAHLNAILPMRGYHSVYREHETNHCPGCGRTHWLIGRATAECAFCATALPLEASLNTPDSALERPRLIRSRAEPRLTTVRLDAVSHRRRAA